MNNTIRLSNQNAGALPDEVHGFVRAVIEGRVKQFALVIEMNDGTMSDQFVFLDDSADRFRMIGGLTVLLRDYMRCNTEGRLEYVPIQDDDDDEGDV